MVYIHKTCKECGEHFVECEKGTHAHSKPDGFPLPCTIESDCNWWFKDHGSKLEHEREAFGF